MMISLFKIYMIFVKIGAILLGGGYVILPIITDELCEKRALINKDDIVNYFGISQSLSGIVAVNISAFAGYKLRGKTGAAAAVAGVITVPFLAIIILASILNTVADNQYLQNALWGIGFAVIVLIFLTVKELWENSVRDTYFYVIFLLSLILLMVVKLSPVQTILIMVFAGILLQKLFNGRIGQK